MTWDRKERRSVPRDVPEDMLSPSEAERLEAEIEHNQRQRIKEAILELLRENPREIYLAARELIAQLRDDADLEIGRKLRRLYTQIAILAVVGLAAVGWWFTHR